MRHPNRVQGAEVIDAFSARKFKPCDGAFFRFPQVLDLIDALSSEDSAIRAIELSADSVG